MRSGQQRQRIPVWIGLLLPLFLSAQELTDPLATLKEKRDFIYGIDNRRTHIKKQSTVIYGVYVGIGFGGKLRMKMGLSGTPFEKGKYVDAHGIVKKNKLFFASMGEEFDFLIIKKFRLTTYFQGGIGFNYFRQLNSLGVEIEKGKDLIIPIEMGFHANYDVLPWLRAKAGGGWRFVGPAYSNDLTGYYIKLGFGINNREAQRAWKKRKAKKAKS